MDFNWKDVPFDIGVSQLTEVQVEESFEDPFAVKLLPEEEAFGSRARFFNLGKTANGTGVISYYQSNGKSVRVIHARPFVEEENYFYLKKLNETLLK